MGSSLSRTRITVRRIQYFQSRHRVVLTATHHAHKITLIYKPAETLLGLGCWGSRRQLVVVRILYHLSQREKTFLR